MIDKSFFEELRETRIARGISLEDIAGKTLINLRFLEAIENGDTAILPSAYVRAFLRQYAAAIGLDPVLTMQRYDALRHGPMPHEASPATAPVRTDAPARPASEAPPWWSHPTTRGIGTTALILAGIVLIAVIAQHTGSPPAKEIPFGDVVKEQEQRFANADSTSVGVLSRPTARGDSLVLRASATDSVWLQIAVDALPPTDYLFPPNAQRSWKARDRFTLTLGNAGGVRFRLNTRDLGTLGKTGVVLRNVEISRDALTSPISTESPE